MKTTEVYALVIAIAALHNTGALSNVETLLAAVAILWALGIEAAMRKKGKA